MATALRFVHRAASPLCSLHRSLFARYSTHNAAASGAWGVIPSLLNEEGTKFPVSPKRPFIPRGGVASSLRRREERWKLFEVGKIIRPHELTYKSRVIAPPSHTKIPPRVAPPTQVARNNDIFYQLGVNPLSQSMNPGLLVNFMTDMGQIQNRRITLLTSKSQRKLAKAIKRARMMGIIPAFSKTKKMFTI